MSCEPKHTRVFVFADSVKATTFLYMFCMFLLPLYTQAQGDSSGIYMNVDDFTRHKISLATPCASARHAIRLHNRPFLSVIYNGHKLRYTLSDVFGYHDCDGFNYRFYLGDKYQVLSCKNLILYMQYKDVGISEMPYYEYMYFFSETLGSIIYPLNFHYLDWVYRRNKGFLKKLHTAFRRNKDLTGFNEVKKRYLLITFYEESIGQAKD